MPRKPVQHQKRMERRRSHWGDYAGNPFARYRYCRTCKSWRKFSRWTKTLITHGRKP